MISNWPGFLFNAKIWGQIWDTNTYELHVKIIPDEEGQGKNDFSQDSQKFQVPVNYPRKTPGNPYSMVGSLTCG